MVDRPRAAVRARPVRRVEKQVAGGDPPGGLREDFDQRALQPGEGNDRPFVDYGGGLVVVEHDSFEADLIRHPSSVSRVAERCICTSPAVQCPAQARAACLTLRQGSKGARRKRAGGQTLAKQSSGKGLPQSKSLNAGGVNMSEDTTDEMAK